MNTIRVNLFRLKYTALFIALTSCGILLFAQSTYAANTVNQPSSLQAVYVPRAQLTPRFVFTLNGSPDIHEPMGYLLEISTSSNFTNPLYRFEQSPILTQGRNQHVLPRDVIVEDGTYHWRVTAFNVDKTSSSTSAIRAFAYSNKLPKPVINVRPGVHAQVGETLTFEGSITDTEQYTATGFFPGTDPITQVFEMIDLNGTIFAAASDGVGVFRSVDNGTNWQKAGNVGAFIETLTSLHEFNGTLFVGGGLSGLWGGEPVYKSDDGGDSWSATSGMDGVLVQDIASSDTTLFAGGLRSGIASTMPFIYKTADESHWELVPFFPDQDLSVTSVSKLIVVDNVLYAATGGGGSGRFYKTSDEGNTWIKLGEFDDTSEPDRIIYSVEDLIYENGIFYALTISPGDGAPFSVIQKSIDGGETWTKSTILPKLETETGEVFASGFRLDYRDGTLYVTAGDGGSHAYLLKSTDDGVTWLNNGIISAGENIGKNPGDVLVTNTNVYLAANIFRSGREDVLVFTINPDYSYRWVWGDGSTCPDFYTDSGPIIPASALVPASYFICTATAEHAYSAEGVYSVLFEVINKRTGAINWETVAVMVGNPMNLYTVPRYLDSYDNGGNAFASLIDAPIRVVHRDTTTSQIIADPQYMLRVGPQSFGQTRIILGDNECKAGGVWTNTGNLIGTNDIVDLLPYGNALFAATTAEAGIYKSIDNGVSWNKLESFATPPLTGVYALAEMNGTIYAGGSLLSKTLYKSDDGGETWQATGPLSADYNVKIFDILVNGNVLYASGSEDRPPFGTNGGDPGTIYKSVDAGVSWTPLDFPSNPDGYDTVRRIIATGVNTLYAGVQYLGPNGSQPDTSIYKSIDAGTSWSLVGGGPKGDVYDFITIDNELYVALLNQDSGSEGRVYKTLDGGSSWIQTSDFDSTNALAFAYADDVLYVATRIDIGSAPVYKSIDRGETWYLTGDLVDGDRGARQVNTLAIAGDRLYAGISSYGNASEGDLGDVYRTVHRDCTVTGSELYKEDFSDPISILPQSFYGIDIPDILYSDLACIAGTECDLTNANLFTDVAKTIPYRFEANDGRPMEGFDFLSRSIRPDKNLLVYWDTNPATIMESLNLVPQKVYETAYSATQLLEDAITSVQGYLLTSLGLIDTQDSTLHTFDSSHLFHVSNDGHILVKVDDQDTKIAGKIALEFVLKYLIPSFDPANPTSYVDLPAFSVVYDVRPNVISTDSLAQTKVIVSDPDDPRPAFTNEAPLGLYFEETTATRDAVASMVEPGVTYNYGAGIDFVDPDVSSQAIQIFGVKKLAYEDSIAHDHFDPLVGSFAVWMKPSWNGNDSINHVIFENFVDDDNYMRLIKTATNELRFEQSKLGVARSVETDVSAWATNDWHFLVATWDDDRGALTLYVDAALVDSINTADLASPLAPKINIGWSESASLAATRLDSTLDELFIFQRELTLEEIQEWYAIYIP